LGYITELLPDCYDEKELKLNLEAALQNPNRNGKGLNGGHWLHIVPAVYFSFTKTRIVASFLPGEMTCVPEGGHVMKNHFVILAGLFFLPVWTRRHKATARPVM